MIIYFRKILLEKGRQKLYCRTMHNDTTEAPIAYKHRGMTTITDAYESKRPGAVCPFCRESVHLVKHMKAPNGSLVLDLRTDSGIIALFV